MPPIDGRIGGGFTEGELDVASFWVRNRLLLRRAGRGFLLGVNILVWAYVLWGLTDAFILSYDRESRIVAEIAQNTFLATRLESNRPQEVRQNAVHVFQGPDDRLDVIVEVHNPNPAWWLEFTYRFNISGELTPARAGFVLPGQRRYLGEFGFRPGAPGARTGTLVVENVRWHRVDPAEVGDDYTAWLTRRDRLQATDVEFIPDIVSGAQRVSRTRFTLVNDSAYGFWDVRLYVVLLRSSTPIAATTVVLERVLPGERRPVDLDWLDTLPAITGTDVSTVVNFLDEASYMPSTQL